LDHKKSDDEAHDPLIVAFVAAWIPIGELWEQVSPARTAATTAPIFISVRENLLRSVMVLSRVEKKRQLSCFS
jgi:hypothetical protein